MRWSEKVAQVVKDYGERGLVNAKSSNSSIKVSCVVSLRHAQVLP